MTIEQLCAYAPYGLMVEKKTEEITEIVELTLFKVALFNDGYYVSFKPILRPLSALKDTDWINMAKIDGWFEDGKEYKCFHYGIKQGRWVLSFNFDGFHVSINDHPARVTNQLQLWGYLFKNHYNVFNLPEGEYIEKV